MLWNMNACLMRHVCRESRWRWFMRERIDVAQPEVVGEDESCTFVVVFGLFLLLC